MPVGGWRVSAWNQSFGPTSHPGWLYPAQRSWHAYSGGFWTGSQIPWHQVIVFINSQILKAKRFNSSGADHYKEFYFKSTYLSLKKSADFKYFVAKMIIVFNEQVVFPALSVRSMCLYCWMFEVMCPGTSEGLYWTCWNRVPPLCLRDIGPSSQTSWCLPPP